MVPFPKNWLQNRLEKNSPIQALVKSDIDSPKGFIAGSLNTGVRYTDKEDCSWLYCPNGMLTGGIFTQNKMRSFSVKDSVAKIKKDSKFKWIMVHSGNANTCVGEKGKESVKGISNKLQKHFSLRSQDILLSFTGIIGLPFPWQKVANQYKKINLDKNKKKRGFFYRGIQTTDTTDKILSLKVKTGKGDIIISGCSKGAGMIMPNMATMLAYITTDLKMKSSEIEQILHSAGKEFFNQISVDGDASTNDSVFLFSSGASALAIKDFNKKDQSHIKKAFLLILEYLAEAIIRDGEGANKLIRIYTKEAKDKNQAIRCAREIANSLLVKTAIFGKDPNYGRILMAIGNAKVQINKKKLSLFMGDVCLYKRETAQVQNIKAAENYLKKNNEIDISVNLGVAESKALYKTCDISYEYVKINAEYTS